MTTLAENLAPVVSVPGRARQGHQHIPWKSLSTVVHRRDAHGPTLISICPGAERTYWRRVSGRGTESVYEKQEEVPRDL